MSGKWRTRRLPLITPVTFFPSRAAIQQSVQFMQDAEHFLVVVFGQSLELLDDAADADALVIDEGAFAVGREADVDLAFVARVDAALDQRAGAVFEAADNARHLRGQYAEDALDVADDHRLMRLQKGQRQEFDLFEIAGAAAAAQRREADLRDDVEEFVRQVFDAGASANGHGRDSIAGAERLPGSGGRADKGRIRCREGRFLHDKD